MSRLCPIWFSSQNAPNPIKHSRSISFSTSTTSIQFITSLFYLVFLTYDTQSNRSQQFSIIFVYITLVCSIKLLSYLVFIPDYTRSDRSRQLSFIFGINQTAKIDHVIVQFFAQMAPNLMGHDNSVSFLTQTAPVQSIMQLSLPVSITDRTRSDKS